VITSLSNAENFIKTMKEFGCRFCLDNFGAGTAPYSYLEKLPVDYVKIDGIFVTDIVNNANDYAVVRSINEIGHFMGKMTIAKNVENQAILEKLRDIGVDYGQGFGLEKPRYLEAEQGKRFHPTMS
jgi:EAL domain-containing protein (putative c-di-GMP-specific phosphodiesterase class I)